MIKICKAQRASQKILSTTNQVYIFVNIVIYFIKVKIFGILTYHWLYIHNIAVVKP